MYPDAEMNDYEQKGSHDGGGGDDDNHVGVEYAGESQERGRSGGAPNRIGEDRPRGGIGASNHH